MSSFILDCSVTIAWFFRDQADAYTESVLESLSKTSALVPDLWYLEVTNALLVAERKKKITPTDSTKILALLNHLSISTFETRNKEFMETLLATGRLYGLSSYDTMYLHLAMVQGLPLATQDKALHKACKIAGIDTYQP